MMSGASGGSTASANSGTSAAASATSQQRSLQRERERYEREQQIQLLTNGEPYHQSPSNPNSNLFDEPIKQQHKDETAKRIKDTLGEFEQLQSFIVSNHKTLLGVSTREISRMRDTRVNKAKIEQILSEMKHNIQPITGLDDSDDATGERVNLNHSNSSSSSSNSSGPTAGNNSLSNHLNSYNTSNNTSANTFNHHNNTNHQNANVNSVHNLLAKNAINAHPINRSTEHRKEPNRTHGTTNHTTVALSDEDISLDEISDENEPQFTLSNRKKSATNCAKRSLSNGSDSSPLRQPPNHRIENPLRKRRRNLSDASDQSRDSPIPTKGNATTMASSHPDPSAATTNSITSSAINSAAVPHFDLKAPKNVGRPVLSVPNVDDDDDDKSSISSDSDSSNSSSSSSSSSDDESSDKHVDPLKKKRRKLSNHLSDRLHPVALDSIGKASHATSRYGRVDSIAQRKAMSAFPVSFDATSPEPSLVTNIEAPPKPSQSWNLATFLNKEKSQCNPPASTQPIISPVAGNKSNGMSNNVNKDGKETKGALKSSSNHPDSVQNVIDAVARGDCAQTKAPQQLPPSLSDSDFSDSLSPLSIHQPSTVNTKLVNSTASLNTSSSAAANVISSPKLQPPPASKTSAPSLPPPSSSSVLKVPHSVSSATSRERKRKSREKSPAAAPSSPNTKKPVDSKYKERTKADSKLSLLSGTCHPLSSSPSPFKVKNKVSSKSSAEKIREKTDVKVKSEKADVKPVKSNIFQTVTNVSNVPKNLLVSINLASLKRPPQLKPVENVKPDPINNGSVKKVTGDLVPDKPIAKESQLNRADVKTKVERGDKPKEISPVVVSKKKDGDEMSNKKEKSNSSKKEKKEKQSKSSAVNEDIENVQSSATLTSSISTLAGTSARKDEKQQSKEKKKEKKDKLKEKERKGEGKEKDRARDRDRDKEKADKDRESMIAKDKIKKEKDKEKEKEKEKVKEKDKERERSSKKESSKKSESRESGGSLNASIESKSSTKNASAAMSMAATTIKEEANDKEMAPTDAKSKMSSNSLKELIKDETMFVSNDPEVHLKEGKRLKHTADKETDRVKQTCAYLEAISYFLQGAHCHEQLPRDSVEKACHIYRETLTLVKFISNKFSKRANETSLPVERMLFVLIVRCKSVLLFTLNRVRMREIKRIETQISGAKLITPKVSSTLSSGSNASGGSVAASNSSNDPTVITVVGSQLNMPMQTYHLMRKQLENFAHYTEAHTSWMHSDELVERDAACKAFFSQLESVCRVPSPVSSADVLSKYILSAIRSLPKS